jgi:hypothetical protein
MSKTREHYVAEVDYGDRLSNLTHAWRTAQEACPLDPKTLIGN